MARYKLAFKPAIGLYGQHDPSAVLFEDGTPVFGIEEERLTRSKHAVGSFPVGAIEACLDFRDLELAELDEILLPYEPLLRSKIRSHYLRDAFRVSGFPRKAVALERAIATELKSRYAPVRQVESRLEDIGTPVPPIRRIPHHRCHAASAFHPSGFDEALLLTVDAKGEYDSTVVWRGDASGVERIHTYDHPNSLGLFYAIVTEFLGYRMFNGEGKVMGLAPYGGENPTLEAQLCDLIDTGVDYNVTALTKRWGTGHGVRTLEETFDRTRNNTPGEFDEWERDLAYTAQKLLEETVTDIAAHYLDALDTANVALAGGVALNCKLNKRIRELDCVENVFIQPVAHDAGLALGAGWAEQSPTDVPPFTEVYFGPSYDPGDIESTLQTNKIEYSTSNDLERYVAERLADGDLVGWFQGRLELGPRALGARSILADPRTEASRDRVNRFVKHREEWRPFAPSILEESVDEYLVEGTRAPFMIDSFDVVGSKLDDLRAVVHPADETTRPQTVNPDQHPRYHRLIESFAELTGVPVVLNTSFNDHGEPIVNTPTEAIKDFYGMGLDLLVIEDFIVEKPVSTTEQVTPVRDSFSRACTDSAAATES